MAAGHNLVAFRSSFVDGSQNGRHLVSGGYWRVQINDPAVHARRHGFRGQPGLLFQEFAGGFGALGLGATVHISPTTDRPRLYDPR